MKKIFYLGLIFLPIIYFNSSCNKNPKYSEDEEGKELLEKVVNRSQEYFYSNNETLQQDLIQIGEYHNEIMNIMTSLPVIQDKCNASDYNNLQEALDSVILNSLEYQSFYQNTSTDGLLNMYLNKLNICDSNNQNANFALHNLILRIDAQLVNEISDFERNFLKQFLFDHLNGNNSSISYYVNIVESNKSEFILDGSYSLGVISIFEHSSNFWTNYTNPKDSISFFLPFIMDACGAYYEGMKDVISNGGTGSNFLQNMGRGACEASIPIVGGDVATFFGW